jgi:Asp-tRNA(Asn)/Glu-tRNA(Gln) amidotransferase A subunit family amidase
MPDLHLLTATEAARRLHDGSLSATALTEACLACAAAREPMVHAFAWLSPTQALRQAARLDAAARAGAPKGRLFGLPFGVKDVLDTADMVSGYGSPAWAGHRPRADAACVASARRAGAVILGKTVTTEFATRHPGPTANPHNLRHTPGGSSSGSAAAVADGMVPLAFGTQTAGSIIRPAAYCGVVGYKPSYGTVARAGMKVMSPSLDTIGVLARSVPDCALAVSALTGRDLGDPAAKPGRAPRLALCRNPTGAEAAPETMALLERAAAAASAAGAKVEELELPPAVLGAAEVHPWLMNMETAQSLAWELLEVRPLLSEVLRERMDWASAEPVAKLDEARARSQEARAAFAAATEGFDAVLTPSAPGEAPEGLGWTGDPAFNLLWTALWVPCVTIPAGSGPRGLPMGVQLVGRQGEDAAVLAWAEWMRAAL